MAGRLQEARPPPLPGGPSLFHGSQHHLASPARVFRQLELNLETLLALKPGRCVRGLLRGVGGPERDRPPGADVRLYYRAGPCLGGWGKRGQSRQALGRSRGGFSTKIHLKTDWDGDPLGFCLTGGEASDSRHFETLLDLGPEITPRAAVGDKGYDTKANRQAARAVASARPFRIARRLKRSRRSFPRRSIAGGLASSRPWANSSGSRAFLYVARRQTRTTALSSRLL